MDLYIGEIYMRYGRVQLPEEMVKRVEQVISDHEELGYADIDDFVEDSVRRRLEAVKSEREPKSRKSE